jgi:hypothetical protein
MRYEAEGEGGAGSSNGWAAVGGYAIVMIAFIYLADSGRLEEAAIGSVVIGLLAVTHIVFGFAIGRWWALSLPLLAILLAVPAGVPESKWREPLPLFFGMALYAPFEMALIALGVGASKLFRRKRRAS